MTSDVVQEYRLASASAIEFAYSGFEELKVIERSLARYNADIVSLISPYLRGKTSVLEFGAGIGTLALEWERQTKTKPECLEIDPRQRRIVAERGFICYRSIEEVRKTFDGVYCSNVFEHIQNDQEVLRQLYSLIQKGGTLAIYVPACKLLFSDMDRSLGHYRRYEKKELVQKAERAGFDVVECRYADGLGFVAWLVAKITSSGVAALTNAPRLRFYDRWIRPVSKALDDSGVRRLFGKNLLLIARK